MFKISGVFHGRPIRPSALWISEPIMPNYWAHYGPITHSANSLSALWTSEPIVPFYWAHYEQMHLMCRKTECIVDQCTLIWQYATHSYFTMSTLFPIPYIYLDSLQIKYWHKTSSSVTVHLRLHDRFLISGAHANSPHVAFTDTKPFSTDTTSSPMYITYSSTNPKPSRHETVMLLP